MSNVLIVGYGVVGHNLARELSVLNPDIYDKYEPQHNTRQPTCYDVAFICVDTPYVDKDHPCDITEVENAINENVSFVYVIKSAVLPGTVDYLKDKTGKHIVVSPEYYGATPHCNNFTFDFTILGGNKKDCQFVIQLLQQAYDGRHSFRITDTNTAELVKYMENAWIATKVTFCTQFYEIAKLSGVSYEELRELFILDPRVNPSHTLVYADHPYWDSHCLNKDVAAIADMFNARFLHDVIGFNDRQKKIEVCQK